MKLISQLSWFFGWCVWVDSSFRFIRTFALLQKPIPPLQKEWINMSPHSLPSCARIFQIFVLPLFRVDKIPGMCPNSRGTGWSIRGPTEVNQSARLPTEVLPELTDLSEALMTEERGEEIKTQLKEMSLGFLPGGNSKIFYFHPDPWGNHPILTITFFKWVETTNWIWICTPKKPWQKKTPTIGSISRTCVYVPKNCCLFFLGGNTV